MAHPYLIRLRGVLKSLDDEALAALANRGLLRRAQKDLEAATPEIVVCTAENVRVRLGEAMVDVPELPAKSVCSCPATGICRHILGALVFLRDDPSLADADQPAQAALFAAETGDSATRPAAAALAAAAQPELSASPADVLGGLTDEELRKWAGKGLLKKALAALAASPEVEIEQGAMLVVRFPSRNIICRWIPSGGLLGMVCSCQAEGVCEHVVAAVLAYQVLLGRRQIVAEEKLLAESPGAPRSRAEVLASVGAALRELIALGLARLSTATAQRLTTLAVSAHGVDLPQLERMLKSLADEVQLATGRDAQASSANLLWYAARCEALRTGLTRRPTAGLVGQHRTQYHTVGQLSLIGLGAQQWRSKGGYHGVTVYFWDESRGGFATWSESRPAEQRGFDPAARFQADGPWIGCPSPSAASRNLVRLSGAWRNPQGRISGRSSTRALLVGPSRVEELPETFIHWSDIAARAKRLFSGGLSERTENHELAVLAPKSWGPASYDPLRQELTRAIFDQEGRPVELWLPFTPENEPAIQRLEQHGPESTRGLLGAIRLVSGRICVQPISLFVDEQIINLNLDKAAAVSQQNAGPQLDEQAASPGAESDEALDEDEAGDLVQAAGTSPLGRCLIAAQAELEAIAESGTAVRRDLELLRGAAKRFAALGLSACSRPLDRLLESVSVAGRLTDPEARHEAAGRVLHAYFVHRLAADQETVALACAGLG